MKGWRDAEIYAPIFSGLHVHETRNLDIGFPIVDASGGANLFAHPLDVWRLRHLDEQDGMTDLDVLARWMVDEVDRRLTKIGLPAGPVYGGERS